MNETYNYSGPGKVPGQSSSISLDVPDDNLSMPLWVRLLWTVVFTVMVAVAVGGNCIVIWIVTGKILLNPIGVVTRIKIKLSKSY